MTDTEPGYSFEGQGIYLTLTLIIQTILGIGLVWFIIRGDWENTFLTALVIALTLLPIVIRRRYNIYIPPEFQLITAAFVFLSLFLGSATDFYYRFWWWDIVLHIGSGFLLGIIGFLAIFLLNGTDRLPKGIKPVFVSIFGIAFAVTLGVIWEIFEFIVDELVPDINMQSRETGVVDTMQDLIVDLIGAIIVAFMGWGYQKSGRYSFVADGMKSFISHNRQLFAKHRERRAAKRATRG